MVHEITKGRSGVDYLLSGFTLIRQPGLRRFVVLPLLTNLVLFSLCFYWLLGELDKLSAAALNLLPGWLSWLQYLLWPLAIITILLVFSFIFGMVANWLAAPFNGLLAEQVEQIITGQQSQEVSIRMLIKDIPRLFLREWQKFLYFLPRALFCLLLFFVPVLGQTLAPVLWLLFCGWMAAIQYCDYPFDNHKIPFHTMRAQLREHKTVNMTFGVLVTLLTSIPLLNLFIMPIAICGATAMWVDRYRQ